MLGRGVRVVDASVTFEDYRLRSPLIISGGTIEEATEAQATVTIEDARGRVARGEGRVFLSALWAWPRSQHGLLERVDAMQQMCLDVADFAPVLCVEYDHPIAHGLRLDEWVDGHRVAVGLRLFIREKMPRLAALVSLSPFAAALHDAYGKLHDRSSYQTLAQEFTGGDLARWLGPLGKGRYLDEFIYPRGRRELDAWLVIGSNDPMREVDAPDLGDGLPASVEGWLRRCGYRCFKLKVKGADPQADAEWVAAVYAEIVALRQVLGLEGQVRYLVDPNEGCEGPWVVLEFLDALQRISPEAYAALEYLEQPTERDLGAYEFDMREIAARKPVFADESLQDLAALERAVQLGWTGPALKTCKGHSATLLEIAWCHLKGRPYTLQDLTNPGLAAVQAAGLGAHSDTLNGVELNVMQFAPASSLAAADEYPDLFCVRDGVHRVAGIARVGLY